MKNLLHVLVVDDSGDDVELVVSELRRVGYDVAAEQVRTREQTAAALARGPWDLILSEYRLPGFGGLDVLALHRELRGEVPFIIVTRESGEAEAVEAMRAGASDWIGKHQLHRLGPAIARELEEAALRREGRAAARWLEAERVLTSAVLDTAGALVLVLGPDGRITRVNRAFEKTLGVLPHEILTRYYWDIFLEPDRAKQEESRFRGLTPASFPREHEAEWQVRGAPPRTIAWSETALFDSSGAIAHVVWTGIDVTEKKALEAKLAHDALHDSLTGLANRLLFLERLGQRIRHLDRHPGSRFAVLYLDLDRFKQVNDTVGHSGGDQFLRSVSRRLEACVRPCDTVARLGGDEFVILLDEVEGVADATRVADRIRESLDEPLLLGGHDISPSASIGIALSSTGYATAESVLRDADTAMYRAKSRGRSRYEIFDQAMRDQARSQLQLEADLRRAIARDELCVYYQPVVRIADGGLVGFEALVRWKHPRRGLILPAEFVPMAEENGLITAVDRWVLGRACRQVKEWRERYPRKGNLSVSVNLSGRHFTQADSPREIQQLLSSAGVPARGLNLEITESVLLENTDGAKQALWNLRSLGAGVHLDDFGTGYASLNYLRNLPVCALKIDRSFVASLGTAKDADAIVQAVVTLAHNLDLRIVAEGVETEEQLRHLRGLGCDYAQGYWFARPLPEDTVESLLGAETPVWPVRAESPADSAPSRESA